MDSNKEKHIVDSWMQNAKPWIRAISQKEIESRQLVTNAAIVNTILSKGSLKVLDIGCGEGWLVRALSEAGIEAHGIDVVPELLDEAARLGGGTFQVLSYEALADGIEEQYDLAVCNFSLLGDTSVNHVFKSVGELLQPNGYFVIQTIHPRNANLEEKYEDGWQEGSWSGFNNQFTNPPPWYFRTLETWKQLFADHGMDLQEIKEPLLPSTDTFASVIFVGQVR